ncbi:hypothetical protein HNR19_002647 [Nocardioides thalensis]|uniref:Fibronectin type III domain-containing protein n=1 Tax=Nocardioides thalensis TaxID=1914755 RepID=A0A853C3S2_9ACTN|nr:hypothetical protein [Nocardioides thalensis]NYJ01949.1 hypothetical protein [Nocardioides thalensis]
MHRDIGFTRAVTTLATIVAAALVGTLLTAGFGPVPPARAVPVSPVVVGPSAGESIADTPHLRWERLAGATSYDVQLSTSDTFTTTLLSQMTTNVTHVPTAALPAGTLYWRVRARDASGVGEWSAVARFEHVPVGAPALTAPANGDRVQQPDKLPTLQWESVAGAIEYELRVGAAVDVDGRFTLIKPKGTSHLFAPTAAGVHQWKVRARLGTGVFTDWSETRTFLAAGPATVTTGMPNAVNPAVEDLVLDWEPVGGAVTYELQIYTDKDEYGEPTVTPTTVTGITGTRYAPPTTLDDRQYYWRVRAVDTYGVKSAWPERPFVVTRRWSEQPEPVHPADEERVTSTAPFYFQWKPARLASRYRLQLSSDPTWTNPQEIYSCHTVHTTYIPKTRDLSQCWPTPGQTWWWRVQGIDGTSVTSDPVTDLIGARVHQFTYETWTTEASGLAPADGFTGPVPTLSWDAVAGASSYEVSIWRTDTGASVATDATSATSYTPRTNLIPDVDTPVTYRWQVVPIASSGAKGNGLIPTSQPTFTVTETGGGTAATPDARPTPSGHRFPTLSWEPLPVPVAPDGRTTPPTYSLWARKKGDTTWAKVAETVQPRIEDQTATRLVQQEYEWFVQAVTSSGSVNGAPGSFSVTPLDPVSGHLVALSGGDAIDGEDGRTCSDTLCSVIPETPVLRWSSVPDAGGYYVYLSHNARLNPLATGCPSECRTWVEGTIYRPDVALPDDQTNEDGYHWHVQPCTDRNHCNPLAYAGHRFQKRSNPVLVAPSTVEPVPTSCPTTSGTGPVPDIGDDVTLCWRDYQESHASANVTGTDIPLAAATIEARTYRVVVATDEAFTTIVDTIDVDQRQFTSFDTTYVDGPLWWKVRAIDGTGNLLPWSRPQPMVKRSPAPELGSDAVPANLGTSDGVRFSWAPMPFAASYEIEIHRNDDRSENTANRVPSNELLVTRQPTLTLPAPLAATRPGIAADDYVWRVRRIDASGHRGPWSAGWRAFDVHGTLTQPDGCAGTREVPPNGAVFSWSATGAQVKPTAYRFQQRSAAGTITETKTVATAWAPTEALAEGTWQWRAIALDANDRPMADPGVAPWCSVHVWGKPHADGTGDDGDGIQPLIHGSGKVGTVLTSTRPDWQPAEIVDEGQETWQWLRDGIPIVGATGTTYQVTAADVRKPISLRVTLVVPGYGNGVTTSNVIVGVTGDAPTSTVLPGIEGTGKVGTDLTLATPGEWTPAGGTVTYQWYRGTTMIHGETTGSYRVRPEDVDQQVRLAVTYAVAGHASSTVESNAITGAAGEQLEPMSRPVITGIAAYGSLLYAAPGTWPQTPRYTYEWLRGGVPIPGATQAVYQVQAADAGRSVSVRVTATEDGYAPGVATSPAVSVPRLASTVAMSVSSTTVRRRSPLIVGIAVSVPGMPSPAGKVAVVAKLPSGQTKTLTTVSLPATGNGTKSVKVRLASVGRNRLRVAYQGTAQINAANSPWTTVTVRR